MVIYFYFTCAVDSSSTRSIGRPRIEFLVPPLGNIIISNYHNTIISPSSEVWTQIARIRSGNRRRVGFSVRAFFLAILVVPIRLPATFATYISASNIIISKNRYKTTSCSIKYTNLPINRKVDVKIVRVYDNRVIELKRAVCVRATIITIIVSFSYTATGVYLLCRQPRCSSWWSVKENIMNLYLYVGKTALRWKINCTSIIEPDGFIISLPITRLQLLLDSLIDVPKRVWFTVEY